MHLCKILKYTIKYKIINYMADLYSCCPSGVGKGTLRSIRIESSVNKINIFYFLRQDLTACLFLPCILIFLIH